MPPTGLRSVARRYCELEADEQRMIDQDVGGEAQGCPMPAETVGYAPASGETPNSTIAVG